MVALEHTLMILLLLVGVLNAKPNLHRLAWWVIGGGILLALISPSLPLPLPWDWLAALAIPLLLWQAGRRLLNARPPQRIDVLIWLFIVLGISGLLLLSSVLDLAGSLMFAVLAASMTWRATEAEVRPSYLGQVGPLALAFLLAEIAPAVEAPNRYLLALLAGAVCGAAIGYLAVNAARGLPDGKKKDILSIGQVYLAYGVSLLLGISAISAAVFSVAIYIAYGGKRGLWPNGVVCPQPLNSSPLFILAGVTLAFFSWQTHVPLTPLLLLEIVLGLGITAVAIFIARWFHSPSFQPEHSYLHVLLRVSFLLAPALLLWPRQVSLDIWPLAFALLIAGLVTFLTHRSLTPLLSLYSWLDELPLDADQPDQVVEGQRVRDFMKTGFITVSQDMPAIEIAKLLVEDHDRIAVVTDSERRLLGIITEGNMFVKEEQLPRTDHTYPALFKEPVMPELLLEQFAEISARHSAAEVMTSNVIWVKDNDPIGKAIRLMVRHRIRYLPVLSQSGENPPELVGLLTRSDLIRRMVSAGE